VRRPRGSNVTRWCITLSTAYDGAFADWNIGLAPGNYEFEDCGNPLCIIGEHSGTYVSFIFAMATNHAWHV
jgi:hypothetical protein